MHPRNNPNRSSKGAPSLRELDGGGPQSLYHVLPPNELIQLTVLKVSENRFPDHDQKHWDCKGTTVDASFKSTFVLSDSCSWMCIPSFRVVVLGFKNICECRGIALTSLGA